MTVTTRVLIGTPAYGGMVHWGYMQSVMQYLEADIPVAVSGIGNESLITRARNTILSGFYHRGGFSHLLFLDSDVYLPAPGLKRLLGHGVDVVGAAVALKGGNDRGERVLNVGRSVGEQGDLCEITRIGTAALLLTRRAVDALVEDAVSEGRVYTPNPARPSQHDAFPVHFDVFRVGVEGNEYLSEDFWVCSRLRKLGFSIWCDPEIRTVHHGTQGF